MRLIKFIHIQSANRTPKLTPISFRGAVMFMVIY